MHIKNYLSFFHLRISDEQARKLMFYLALVAMFCKKSNLTLAAKDIKRGLLTDLISRHGPSYLLSDAEAFDTSIPRGTIEKDKELIGTVQCLLLEVFPREDLSTAWMIQFIDIFLEPNSLTPDLVITPPSVRLLIARLAESASFEHIFEVNCKLSVLGLDVLNRLQKLADASFAGVDSDEFLCSVSRVLLFLCDVKSGLIEHKSKLDSAHGQSETHAPTLFISDIPPAGHRLVSSEPSFPFFEPNQGKIYPDWYIMLSAIGQMKDGDLALFIETKGPLVRSKESFLRKRLIENDLLEAVIRLPSGLYPNHSLPMNVMICRKGRPTSQNGNELFADLSRFTQNDPVNCRTRILTDDGIEKICNAYNTFSENEFVRIVNRETVQQNDYSLHPPLYLTTKEPFCGQTRLRDVARVTRGLTRLDSTVNSCSNENFLLNVRNIQDNKIVFDELEQLEYTNHKWDEKFLIQEDDIIITCKGSALKIAIVPPDHPKCYISGNLTLIRVDPKHYHPYVLYEYLTSDEGKNALSIIQTGTTIRILSTAKLEALCVPCYGGDRMHTVGDALKNAALQFEQTLCALQRSYNTQKDFLLEELNQRRREI